MENRTISAVKDLARVAQRQSSAFVMTFRPFPKTLENTGNSTVGNALSLIPYFPMFPAISRFYAIK
jgi:hypothetical protein